MAARRLSGNESEAESDHELLSQVSGVTIVTPIRNDPGRVRSPHANVWGRLVPNHLPTGKKASIRSQIDLPN